MAGSIGGGMLSCVRVKYRSCSGVMLIGDGDRQATSVGGSRCCAALMRASNRFSVGDDVCCGIEGWRTWIGGEGFEVGFLSPFVCGTCWESLLDKGDKFESCWIRGVGAVFGPFSCWGTVRGVDLSSVGFGLCCCCCW